MSGRRVRARYGVCGLGARTRGADPKSEGRNPKSEIRTGGMCRKTRKPRSRRLRRPRGSLTALLRSSYANGRVTGGQEENEGGVEVSLERRRAQ